MKSYLDDALEIKTQGDSTLIDFKAGSPLSQGVIYLLLHEIQEHPEKEFICQSLSPDQLLSFLSLSDILPRNLRFSDLQDANGKRYYLGDIIHNIELGVPCTSIHPLINQFTLQKLMTNICPLQHLNQDKSQAKLKKIIQFVSFDYSLYSSIQAEIFECNNLFDRMDIDSDFEGLELLQDILLDLKRNLLASYIKWANQDESYDPIRVLTHLLNSIERGSNFTNCIEDVASDLGLLLNNSNNVLVSSLMRRIQQFDGYRQMLERRVEDSRDLRYLLHHHSEESLAGVINNWFQNSLLPKVSFELEIKLFEHYFGYTAALEKARERSGTVMLFNELELAA